MEWKIWSCLPLSQREYLPNQPGIYVVVDMEEQVWYVGQSKNLNARWNGKGHHRYKQLNRTNNKRLYKIYWKNFLPEQLDEKEELYISLFKPHLNYSRVKTYARKAIQPYEEVRRLLKGLNKKTMLFPDVRSVVLGYYREMGEDEEEILREFTCVVVVVNVNDHDKIILNSYNKAHSKKHSSLKGCWCTYESQCGRDSPTIRPALIPVFVLGSIVYEFVCHPGLLDKLEQNRTCICTIELAKQHVLALKDMDILPSLSVDSRNPLFRSNDYLGSEDYLEYRAVKLQSILQLLPEVAGV